MDRGFMALLFFVSLTGLLLLALRDTSWMAVLLAVHLGFVMAFSPHHAVASSPTAFIAAPHCSRTQSRNARPARSM